MIDKVGILQVYEYAVQSRLGDGLLRSVNAHTVVERMGRLQAQAVTTTFTVPGEQLAEYRYPRDWWQAVKARFGPQWALRRWPVVETVVTAKALYPRLSLPAEEATIRFEARQVPPPEMTWSNDSD